MILHKWAADWGIPAEALADLQHRLAPALTPVHPADLEGRSESAASAQVRLEASRLGWRLWRNNVGVLRNEAGRPVRYGLANESARINAGIKSGDLIGIRPVLITSSLVGQTIGQFVSREMKAPGWTFNPRDEREAAQARWASLIVSLGGDAAFSTGRL